MKVRTKILLVSAIAVLLASLVGNGIIWKLDAQVRERDALLKVYRNCYQLKQKLTDYNKQEDREISAQQYLSYFLKQQKDDYNVCYMIDDKVDDPYGTAIEIYNHTFLTAKELEADKYVSYEEMEYRIMRIDGRNYAVFRMNAASNCILYHLEDITYVEQNMIRMAVYMLLITGSITGITILILMLLLRQLLKPLQTLNNTTRSMAEGHYDQRIEIIRKDEFGQLGDSFNKMAEAVETRTHSLEESEYKKTLFMGNLTHELKTPMTAISGYAQTLLTMKLPDEEKEEALSYIYSECGRLERLSRKMMKLLELDQNTELTMTDHSARELFDAAIQSCQVLLDEKQIRLEVEEHGEVFQMDLDLMTDVVINLIDNAVKASEPGSSIWLRASGHQIEVRDSGSGIPEEELNKILEPFYMVDKSRSRKKGGAGLGLALVQLIVERHHGSMQIESHVGEGTRMILQFD